MYAPPRPPEIRARVMGTTNEVAVQGEIDLASCPDLEAELVNAFRDGPETIVLDLREMTFIDSVAISVIRDARNRADQTGIHLIVLTVDGPVQRLFELCGIAAILDSHAQSEDL